MSSTNRARHRNVNEKNKCSCMSSFCMKCRTRSTASNEEEIEFMESPERENCSKTKAEIHNIILDSLDPPPNQRRIDNELQVNLLKSKYIDGLIRIQDSNKIVYNLEVIKPYSGS